MHTYDSPHLASIKIQIWYVHHSKETSSISILLVQSPERADTKKCNFLRILRQQGKFSHSEAYLWIQSGAGASGTKFRGHQFRKLQDSSRENDPLGQQTRRTPDS